MGWAVRAARDVLVRLVTPKLAVRLCEAIGGTSRLKPAIITL